LGNLSKREKILIINVTFLLLFYSYYSLYLSKMLTKIQGLSSELKEVALSHNVNTYPEVLSTNQITRSEESIIRYNSALIAVPENKMEAQIACDIKSFADASHITISNISIENTPASKEEQYDINEDKIVFNTLSVKINISGDMKSIINFLSLIENGSRVATINDINLNKTNENAFLTNASICYYFGGSKITSQK
jgi:Tfp pilus assembly protein PilO